MSVAYDILREAESIVEGTRNETHGQKERSFQMIGELWSIYLNSRADPYCVSARDVSMMMVLMKIARSVQGTPVRDHFLDCCGYAAIAGELAELETNG